MIDKVDTLAIGGAMANTLLYAQGVAVGRSLCERDMADNARQILALAAERSCRVILPEDAVVGGRAGGRGRLPDRRDRRRRRRT